METVFEKVEIKEEDVGDNLRSGESTSNRKMKCGEVFSTQSGSLTLVCCFCESEFNGMILFGQHLCEKHQNELFHGDYDLKSESEEFSTKMEYDVLPLTPPSKDCASTELEAENTVEIEALGHCETCGVTFKSERGLKRHKASKKCLKKQNLALPEQISQVGKQKEKVPEEIETIDQEFDFIFEDSSNDSSETDTKEPVMDDEIACDICDRKYKHQRSLYKHKYRKHNNEITKPTISLGPIPSLFCIPCNRYLKTRATHQRHGRRHAQERKSTNNCTTTPNNATEQSEIMENQKVEEMPNNPNLFCDLCHRYFKTKTSLRHHAENHDTIPQTLQDDDEFLQCKYCYEKLSTLEQRKQHENSHSGEKLFQCPHCPKKFSSTTNRAMHLRYHTGQQLQQCPHCPKTFRDKRDLRRHVDRHLNIRNFPCEHCDKSFFRSYELIKHIRTHTKEKPYVCDVCGRGFSELAPMKGHRRRHFGEKNHKCEICERLFYSLGDLKVHRVSHFNEKPYECEVCGRKFSRPEAMKKHMKLHSDIKAYVCNICGKAYAQDSGLYAHRKSHGSAV